MKNLHLIPTDKPSRLYKRNHDNSFGFSTDYFPNIGDTLNQNIYITSDEEVKEGDYFLYDGTKIRYKSNGTEYHGRDLCHISGNHRYPVSESKKIILTTDQDLIKNGIQAIDDEFLEWFIKNPNCEEVEVVSTKTIPALQLTGNGHCWWKIIIPKEEPKQETIEKDPCNFCGKTLREQMKGCNEITCYRQFLNKQETLEEAAERLSDRDGFVDGALFGAKWQQERSYSEEDMINFSEWVSIQYPNQRRFLTTNDKIGFYTTKELLGKWFEQFKK
jgi:hypothetical protein